MMKLIIIIFAALVSVEVSASECSPLLDFNVRTLNEKTNMNLCEAYQGKVLLVVNTAIH